MVYLWMFEIMVLSYNDWISWAYGNVFVSCKNILYAFSIQNTLVLSCRLAISKNELLDFFKFMSGLNICKLFSPMRCDNSNYILQLLNTSSHLVLSIVSFVLLKGFLVYYYYYYKSLFHLFFRTIVRCR